jgi:DNA helicase-2/ATP-dependent DNA helicase PcrA
VHPDPKDSLIAGLNAEQAKAVRCTEGPLLVLAGAGSGKTRVIVHRVAHILARGIEPSGVLAVTFTNKAAREMRERVHRLVGIGGIRVQTFHAFCAAFLRLEFPAVGRSGAFTIYDETDSAALLKSVLAELGLDPETHRPASILARISSWKNSGIGPEEAAATARRPADEDAARAYALYETRIREAEACDFDDLLLETRRVLEAAPTVLARWQDRISHVLVDEFQDTNRIQYELVRRLTARHHNLCVTGDQDQAIYSWRGARAANFDDFLRDHPAARVVKLERNYRSTGNILAVASRLIAHNERRIPKRLWTPAPAGEPVQVLSFFTDAEEADSIAARVTEYAASGRPRASMAVLFRTNALSFPIERAFLQAGIPYVMVGGLEFFARQEVKDLLAWLRFLVNPADVVSFRRVVNLPPRGIGAQTQAAMLQEARRSGRHPGDLARDPAAVPGLSSRARRAVEGFAAVLGELARARELPPSAAAERVLEVTGYGAWWEGKSARGGSLDPWQNLGQLVRVARDFEEKKGGSLADFLAEIALLTDVDRTAGADGAVSLMTMHAAKGLEFDVVFIAGVDRTLLPHAMADREGDGEEEERRLLHVGITRARELCILTHAMLRQRFGSATATGPSPFLLELGAEGVVRSGEPGAAAPAWEEDAEAPAGDGPAGEDSGFVPGARVWHPDWGQGTITAVRGRGRGPDRKLTVAFASGEERILILRHSALELAED